MHRERGCEIKGEMKLQDSRPGSVAQEVSPRQSVALAVGRPGQGRQDSRPGSVAQAVSQTMPFLKW
jgi:hypothetical protein